VQRSKKQPFAPRRRRPFFPSLLLLALLPRRLLHRRNLLLQLVQLRVRPVQLCATLQLRPELLHFQSLVQLALELGAQLPQTLRALFGASLDLVARPLHAHLPSQARHQRRVALLLLGAADRLRRLILVGQPCAAALDAVDGRAQQLLELGVVERRGVVVGGVGAGVVSAGCVSGERGATVVVAAEEGCRGAVGGSGARGAGAHQARVGQAGERVHQRDGSARVRFFVCFG